MTNQITLNEAQLRQLVSECVEQALLEEGFLKDVVWGGLSRVGRNTGYAVAQGANKVAGDFMHGVTDSYQAQINQQIEKIETEVERLNSELEKLYDKRDKYRRLGKNAIDRANDYAQRRDTSTRYTNDFETGYDEYTPQAYTKKQYDARKAPAPTAPTTPKKPKAPKAAPTPKP